MNDYLVCHMLLFGSHHIFSNNVCYLIHVIVDETFRTVLESFKVYSRRVNITVVSKLDYVTCKLSILSKYVDPDLNLSDS